jgi:methylmalonyl-CoA decarboxylase
VAVSDGVGTLTLDHPAKRNALGEALIGELVAALDGLASAAVRAVVLRARPGVTVWSAGHDIDELPTTPRDPLGWSEPLRQLVRRLQGFPAPVIALIEGGVWGGACEVVFACDLVVATPGASFAITPAKLGVPYNVMGLKALTGALPEPVLKEMIFTARPIGAERAWRLGAVNHLVPAERITGFTEALARRIAANPPPVLAAFKAALKAMDDRGLSAAQFEGLRRWRRRVGTSRDYREGLAAFAEKRSPVFRGD